MSGSRPIHVILIAPPLSVVGGQSVQAARLLTAFASEPGVKMSFLPASLPESLGFLRHIPLVRTAVMMLCFHTRLLARIWGADIVHVFTAAYFSFLWTPAPSLALAKLTGRKSILNYRDGRGESHLRDWKSARRLVGLADALVSPSEYLAEIFRGYGLAAQCIPNILDSRHFRYRERGPLRPVFLHNRGYEPLYNVPCTMRAFAIVQKHYPQASLTLAHDGPGRAAFEQLARELELRNVTFAGHVSQQRMAELYDEADIYWMSPNFVCMPGSVLESYAAGLPVIATNAGGMPYVVKDGETGLVVERNDHEAMAHAALRLIEDAPLARRIAANARAELAKYDAARVRAQWRDLYNRLAGKPAAP
jgi:glycosyltransferase involved in cell wall biosynthesis